MKLQITGRHIEVTDAIKEFVEEKVEFLSKHAQKIIKIHVVVEVQNLSQKCEINLEAKQLHLNAHAESKNLYESIGKCVDKLLHQLEHHKMNFGDKNHRVSTKEFEKTLVDNEALELEDSVS